MIFVFVVISIAINVLIETIFVSITLFNMIRFIGLLIRWLFIESKSDFDCRPTPKQNGTSKLFPFSELC
jgi:hypothetical protein